MSLVRLNDDLPSQGVQAFGMKSGGRAVNKESATSQALDALSKFIPTEMLAPYVAVLAYAAEHNSPPSESVYLWFVLATPFVTIFFQYAKRAMDNQPWPAMNAVVWRAICCDRSLCGVGSRPAGQRVSGRSWRTCRRGVGGGDRFPGADRCGRDRTQTDGHQEGIDMNSEEPTVELMGMGEGETGDYLAQVYDPVGRTYYFPQTPRNAVRPAYAPSGCGG